MSNQPLCCFFFCLLVSASVFSQQQDSTHIYYNRVVHPTETSHLPSGYVYYLRQTEVHLTKGDTLQAMDTQRLAAIASFKLGNFAESEQLAVAALGWLQSGKYTDEEQSHKVGLYNQLGKIYRNMAHYDKALSYYNLALAHVGSTGDSITLYNNRGNVYSELGDYAAAGRDLQQAITMSRNISDTGQLARAMSNLGALKLKQGNLQGADDLREALQLREQINDPEGIYSGYRQLAFFALSEKDTAAAKTYATQTLHYGQELNSPSFILESLSILMDLSNDTLVYRYKTLTDSINRAKQEEQFLYAALRFDVEKEKLNTQRAELELEKQRSQKGFILIISLLLLVLLVLVIVMILSRIKRIKQAEVLKTENRISKKVHDEVANEVYQVMVRLQVNPQKQEEVLDDLEHIYNKSRDISKEYQVLDSSIPFSQIITDLLNCYQSEGVKIMVRYNKTVYWERFSQSTKNTVYRVLLELMTNMKKHSKATLVVVSFTQNGEKLTINYSDNGVGTDLKKQNGLQNAENRIFALNGSITFETQPNKGFKVTITL